MRKISKAAAALTAGCMLLSTSAFAAIEDNIDGKALLVKGEYTVNLDYTTAGQSTIIVLTEGTKLADANEDNILYINQGKIDEETGEVSYAINLGTSFAGNAVVYAGGTAETATELGILTTIKDVEKLTLTADVNELEFGQTATLTATVIPDDATNKTVEWTGDVKDVVTVGNVTTAKFVAPEVSEDTDFVITAKAGNFTETVTIKVKAKVVVPETPARDFISATNTDKGTIKVDVASVTDASMGIAVGNKIVSLALNAEAYPETGYIVKAVDADGVAIEDAVVFYSTERAKYVALIPTSVADYKFEVLAADTEGETANAVIKKYGNMNEDATGAINILDVGQFQKIFKKTADSAAKTDAKKALIADVTGDGRVNILDVGQFQKAFKKQGYTFNVLTK